MLASPIVKFVFALSVAVVVLSLCPGARASIWPTDAERIAQQLTDADAQKRRDAVGSLASLSRAVATPLVLSALDDDDPWVRVKAAEIVVAWRLVTAANQVIPWLSEPDASVRLAACRVLGAVGEAAVVPGALTGLARVLSDADVSVRLAATIALGQMQDRQAVGYLLGHLDDSNEAVRLAVVRALGQLDDPRALVPLLGKLQDATVEVRCEAAHVLGVLGGVDATSAQAASSGLLLALRDSSDDVKVHVIDALAKLRQPDAVPALASLLAEHGVDPAPRQVRDACVRALGCIGTDAARRVLVGLLQTDDPNAEESSVRDALVQQGAHVVPVLVSRINGSSDPREVAAAMLVLARMEGQRHADIIVQTAQQGRVSPAVGVRALGMLGSARGLAYVLEQLDGPERVGARVAARAILEASGGDGRAVEPIEKVLKKMDITAQDRTEVVLLLGATGSPRAVPTLAAIADTTDAAVRGAAMEALGMLAKVDAKVGSERDKVLVKGLSDQNADVRMKAAIALWSVGQGASVGALTDLLQRAPSRDLGAIGVALSGVVARAGDDEQLSKLVAILSQLPWAIRDAALEGLGANVGLVATKQLSVLAGSKALVGDRRKVAEVLSVGGNLVDLRRLARDGDPWVRANALWSLGMRGEPRDAEMLQQLVNPGNSAVIATNAAGAYGQLAVRAKVPRDAAIGKLCSWLYDRRAFVRTNALASLAMLGARCGDGSGERGLVLNDPSSEVRRAAVELLNVVASAKPRDDVRVLRRCWMHEPVVLVAGGCALADSVSPRPAIKTEVKAPAEPTTANNAISAAGVSVAQGWQPLLVFVVESENAIPTPMRSFALVLPDGRVRMGLSDRRGGLFQPLVRARTDVEPFPRRVRLAPFAEGL